jgi:pyruvate/2-oxoglutarate dehydrogenase complex dihydrolipoamide dehydrogenase (E3) component
MTDTEFDVVVVGGGLGGVTAAHNLASAGLAVALVEDRLIGGECHYWACNRPRHCYVRGRSAQITEIA